LIGRLRRYRSQPKKAGVPVQWARQSGFAEAFGRAGHPGMGWRGCPAWRGLPFSLTRVAGGWMALSGWVPVK